MVTDQMPDGAEVIAFRDAAEFDALGKTQRYGHHPWIWATDCRPAPRGA